MGLKNILSISRVYQFLMNFLTNDQRYAAFVSEYICPQKGDRVLDIGCGPARVLSFLPDVEYIGIDVSKKYIDSAAKLYGDRGTFVCEDLNEDKVFSRFSNYDIILALGLIHHLNDEDAVKLLKIIKRILKSNGRLISFDGCFVKGQSRIERFILSHDRGRYVRTLDQYIDLVSKGGMKVKAYVRNDLITIIPYTHIIMECVV